MFLSGVASLITILSVATQVPTTPAMQAYFGEGGREQAHFDQASAILDSDSEEAWRETKMRPREWALE